MNVLYTCDNNYVWLMGISAISMFENNKEIIDLDVYLIGENISDENKQILADIGEKYNRRITVFDVPQLDIPDALVSARWPLSAFIRLYAGELLPDSFNKILYLDCDTIIYGSLSTLDNWDVSEKVFWGVKDCIGKEYKKNIGIEGNGLYVNAGVLLINLSKLRRISVKDKLASYMSKYEKLISFADQDVLNGAFKGSIGVLPPQYDVMTIVATYSYEDIVRLRKPTNYYSEEEIINAVTNPILIHYTTNMLTVRPWFSNTNHPLSEKFRQYMSISPWSGRVLSEMHFIAKEAKIIKLVNCLPPKICKRVLGKLHSTIKPLVVRIKAHIKV